ncbi:MAG: asparagine synthase (glutamine-hydrolyzing), partial [Bacteroidetes bacterium]
MCGIAGFFNPGNKQIPEHFLDKFATLQQHRGPDYTGTFYNNYLGFAHNRLSILDLSPAANQPFQENGYALVYNGEIYNFVDLRKELEDDGVEFRSTGDTEVLFRCLIHFGVKQTVARIRGMFAFAFWNERENALYLVRDRVGIKPLFYAILDGTLFFASEMKALTHTLPFTLDETRVLYATLGILEKSLELTAFKELYHVPPGCILRFGAQGISKTRYFSLAGLIDKDAYARRSQMGFAGALDEFKSLFDASVKKMLVSDAPMGAYVSGGIDSSLIAASACQFTQSDFKLFTANVLGKYSEFDDAKLLSKTLDRELLDYPFEPEFFIRDLTKVTWHYESPVVVHANAVPFSNVSGLARKSRVKAVLTGEGSDEMFLGYPRLLTRRYDGLIKLPFTILNKLYGLVPPLKSYMKGGGAGGIDVLFEKLTHNFTRDLLRDEGMKRLEFLPEEKRKEHYLTIQMLNEGIVSLLWRNDRMGMIHSIEARFPFLDEDLLEFAVNLPSEYKIGRIPKFYNYKHPFLIDKKIVRKAAEGILPEKLIYKKKNGFPL